MSNEEQTILQRVEGKLAQVLELLSGNPLDVKDNGIIGRQHETKETLANMQKDIVNVNNKVNRYIWIVTGACGLTSLIFAVIGVWIEYKIMMKP